MAAQEVSTEILETAPGGFGTHSAAEKLHLFTMYTFRLDNLSISVIIELLIDLTPKLRIAAKDSVAQHTFQLAVCEGFVICFCEAVSFGIQLFCFRRNCNGNQSRHHQHYH